MVLQSSNAILLDKFSLSKEKTRYGRLDMTFLNFFHNLFYKTQRVLS